MNKPIVSSKWKTIRVFISSTFRDMHAERDYLVRFVFPRLREHLLPFRIHLVDVDLRWGVTNDQDAFELCMDEIDRCHPRFICMLGGRFGWVPPPKRIPKFFFGTILSDSSPAGVLTNDERNSLKLLYSSAQQEGYYQLNDKPRTSEEVKVYFEQGEIAVLVLQRAGLSEAMKSITASEIHHGALEKLDKAAFRFFYFRNDNITNSIPQPFNTDYQEPPNSISSHSLKQIKKQIKNPNTKGKILISPGLEADLTLLWHDYSCDWDFDTNRITNLKEFGNFVFNDLLNSVLAEFGDDKVINKDEFWEENSAMEEFIERCSERFILGSRKTILNELFNCINRTCENNGYICLTGTSGIGKSALMAYLSRHSTLNQRESILLITHFVGASAGSTDLRITLRRLCNEMKSGCSDITEDIPDDLDKLKVAFGDFLQKACKKIKIVILLDAVNQFNTTTFVNLNEWLPENLPTNAVIIISTIAGHITEDVFDSFKPYKIQLKPLKLDDNIKIIEKFSERYRKKFEPEQRDALLAKDDVGLPLFLLTALEELRTLGTYEEITKRIKDIPSSTQDLFIWILNRLQDDDGFRNSKGQKVGIELVSNFAAFLSASRFGLSQKEIFDLLEPNDPEGNVAALLQLLRPYLMQRNEFIDFFHGQFRNAAYSISLSKKEERINAHHKLKEYFLKTADPEGNRTWNNINSTEDKFLYSHALDEVSYHVYMFAKESGESTLLYSLTDDQHLRDKQFEQFGSPIKTIELIGYSLEVTSLALDTLKLVHFTMLRLNFTASLAEKYLYRLPLLIREDNSEKLELAIAIVRQISEPAHRQIGLLLIAWILRTDPIRKSMVIGLIKKALIIESHADVYSSALLMEISNGLIEEGYIQSIAIFNLIPPSPLRDIYERIWGEYLNGMGSSDKRNDGEPVSLMPIQQSEFEEYHRIRLYTQNYANGMKPWPRSKREFEKEEIEICEKFGRISASGVYFIMASDQIQSGNENLAEVLITRGIYLYESLPSPILRTFSATVEAFALKGERDMALEQEGRIKTLTKIAEHIARTPLEKAQLDDERRELMITTDNLANTWRAPGTHNLFQQAMNSRAHQKDSTKVNANDAHSLLSKIRILFAENQIQSLTTLLNELLKVIPEVSHYKQPGFYVATYCIARVCKETLVMQESAGMLALKGLFPEFLFPVESSDHLVVLLKENKDSADSQSTLFSQKIVQIVKVLIATDPSCIAAVASSLRINGQKRVLFELLWQVANLGVPSRTIDPLLCELVRFPELTVFDLRKISDEVLLTTSNLSIPSGLGYLYYPGIMLTSAWTSIILLSTGLSSTKNFSSLFPIVGIFLLAGLLGSFADLLLWRIIRLWERPEKSRKWTTESGTIISFILASTLINSLYSEIMLKTGAVALGFLAGITMEGLTVVIFKRQLFQTWKAKSIILGSLGAGSLALLSWWLISYLPTNESLINFLHGLFIVGGLGLSWALNILPKHFACIKHLRSR